MIHIGAIRKIFRGWRLLICAWVDDNSPLKSQFFALFRGENGKDYIKIGKGYDATKEDCPRVTLAVAKWSFRSYVGKDMRYTKSWVWFGVGKFMDGKDL